MLSKMLFVMILITAMTARGSDKDIRVPTQLWENIEKFSGEIKDGTFSFFPVTIILKNKTEGVLNKEEEEIALPRGGGEIDLAKLVKEDKGTFTVHFEIEGLEKTEDLQVYFISQARKRKIDGEIWGAGCNKFLDIRSYFIKTIMKEGLTVNATRNRHLTVLGGTFVFVRKSGKQVLLSQVTFTDSSQPKLFCGGEETE